MSKSRGFRNSGLQGLEHLEDRRVLSAGGLKDWLATVLPLAPDVPAAVASASDRDARADVAAARSSDHKKGDADDSGMGASVHTIQSALLKAIDALGGDSAARVFNASESSSEDHSAVQEKNQTDNDADIATSGAAVSSGARGAADKDISTKPIAVIKLEPAAALQKAASTDTDKDDAVASHPTPSSAAAARAIVAVEIAARRPETPADRKDDSAERNGFLLAAQHHEAAADADDSPEWTGAFGAFSTPDASLVARNSSDEMARNLRAYTTQDSNRVLPGWIAVDLSRATEPGDQIAAALFAESAGGSAVALADAPQGLFEFAPTPGAAPGVDMDQLLSQVGSLGRQLGDSLAGNDLSRWLLALATASAAVTVVRQQRRRASAPLGLYAGADHTTWTLAALPEPFSTASDL